MSTKKILAAICAIIMPLTSWGAIDLLSLINKTGPIDSHLAKNLLSVCYLHNPQELNNATINVDEIKQINGNTVFLCSVKHNSLPTEYYLTTIGNRHGLVVDGTLLGHNGDAKILEIKVPRDELIYKSEPTINFEFKNDTIKALRNYQFFTTARGGNWFIKEGTICNPFVVDKDGKIKNLTPTATAIREDGDANYLSENHKQPTRSQTSGEYYHLGMQVLSIAEQPASEPLNIEKLNNEAGEMMRIADQYKEKYKDKGEDPPENPETMCVIEFAVWSFNLGMRNSTEFLTWVAKNPKEDLSKFFIVVASQNDSNELQWLKDRVKELKDKKARKWWEKWIKNNI